ncbi:ciliated left-right organizer protein containing ZP-N domains homolog [Salmo trutta]|uniref:ciliated left-right organizer protein containing ZP-N domains homolog n=1 Tax=Salmo trutta TaxID=8032 RepID=UPI001130D60D|nr:uncharacterized protein C1orf127 homolog [Salmo trutta]
MEVWIHRIRIEGLRLWLSGALRIQVISLAFLDQLNLQLSACGFSLHKDPDKNYIFRVMYNGCFVQHQQGNNVLVLNLVKRINRFGGRTHSFIMKCPMVPEPPNREHIQCDPDDIQVIRQIPLDSWNNELHWSLSLRGNLIVALEDASLIQVYADINGASITVQGKRREILSPVTVSCHIVAIQEITMETNNVTTFWNQPDRCVHHSDSTKLIMLVTCRELFAFQ